MCRHWIYKEKSISNKAQKWLWQLGNILSYNISFLIKWSSISPPQTSLPVALCTYAPNEIERDTIQVRDSNLLIANSTTYLGHITYANSNNWMWNMIYNILEEEIHSGTILSYLEGI